MKLQGIHKLLRRPDTDSPPGSMELVVIGETESIGYLHVDLSSLVEIPNPNDPRTELFAGVGVMLNGERVLLCLEYSCVDGTAAILSMP